MSALEEAVGAVVDFEHFFARRDHTHASTHSLPGHVRWSWSALDAGNERGIFGLELSTKLLDNCLVHVACHYWVAGFAQIVCHPVAHSSESHKANTRKRHSNLETAKISATK